MNVVERARGSRIGIAEGTFVASLVWQTLAWMHQRPLCFVVGAVGGWEMILVGMSGLL